MKIQKYSFGRIVVNGKEYTSDLILLPDGSVVSNWWRKEGHRLSVEDLKDHLPAGTKRLVVGTGAHGCMVVDEGFRVWADERGIALDVAETAEAVRIYNRLAGQGGVAGAFHLTC